MDTQLLGDRNLKRMLYRALSIMILMMFLLAFNSCRGQTPSAPRLLKAGDDLNGMVVTTGVADASPLEVYCTFEIAEDATNTIDCQVPALPKLAIGRMIGLTGGPVQKLDWSEAAWEVYLDGYLLDLDTFGEYSYAEPGPGSSPSPVREVFVKKKSWDVVVMNPTFGMHTLICTVRTKAAVYNWVVNFMIGSANEQADRVDQSAVPNITQPRRLERLFSAWFY